MIVTLSGVVSEKLRELVVIEVQGVGYGVYVTPEDYGQLKVGEPQKLYIYDYLRENTHELYGFSELDTKSLFEQLLGVNGVGPRMALSILSTGPAQEVREAIANGDVKYLQAAAGVGRRVAERVVVDLKDKVGIEPGLGSSNVLTAKNLLMKDEAVEALVSLGYTTQDAAKALESVDTALPTDQRVKAALKGAF